LDNLNLLVLMVF